MKEEERGIVREREVNGMNEGERGRGRERERKRSRLINLLLSIFKLSKFESSIKENNIHLIPSQIHIPSNAGDS